MGEIKPSTWYDGHYKLHQIQNSEYMKEPEESFYYPVWEKVIDMITTSGVLDLGCGPGQFGKLCLQKGFSYRGVDFSPRAIEMAGIMTGRPELFQVGDVMTFKNYSKDVTVVSLEVLEHLLADTGLLYRIPSGTPVIFSVPNYDYKSHVRFFKTEKEVMDRYNHPKLFRKFTCMPVLISNTQEKIIWLAKGTRG